MGVSVGGLVGISVGVWEGGSSVGVPVGLGVKVGCGDAVVVGFSMDAIGDAVS